MAQALANNEDVKKLTYEKVTAKLVDLCEFLTLDHHRAGRVGSS